jgi:hypothetical protein
MPLLISLLISAAQANRWRAVVKISLPDLQNFSINVQPFPLQPCARPLIVFLSNNIYPFTNFFTTFAFTPNTLIK